MTGSFRLSGKAVLKCTKPLATLPGLPVKRSSLQEGAALFIIYMARARYAGAFKRFFMFGFLLMCCGCAVLVHACDDRRGVTNASLGFRLIPRWILI